MNILLAHVVVVPLVPGAALSYAAGRARTPARRRLSATIAGAAALCSLACLLARAPPVFAGETLLAQWHWLPQAGLVVGVRLDGLSLLFALLICAIGALVVLYAAYYLGPDDPAGKFYGLLMLFMGAMLGVVLSDNLLLLVVFWELTSVSSFLLVGYWGERPDARAGARVAITITGAGGLALLAGVILLGGIGGSYDLSVLLDRGDAVRGHPHYPIVLLLFLAGAFTKSAQLPFHFWLPEAMAAPTPVSAYLHSATLVKAGVFLLARIYPVLGGTTLFENLVAGTGLATLAFAAYVAVFRHDLKGLLAYSTISHLGLITFLIGLDTPLSAVAAMFHVLNHATFKASLFMTAGIIDHETGTRDMRRLGGLARAMPWTATLAMIAAGAMAGVPLANGFLSKEMFFGEALRAQGQVASWFVPLVAGFFGICSVAYSLRFIHDVFFNGAPRDLPKPHPHEPPLFMKAPVAVLAVLCVVVGVLPAATFGPLVHVAAGALLHAPPPEVELAIWHGFNAPLLMSAIAIAGGVAMYFALQRQWNLHLHHPRGIVARRVFRLAIDRLFALARRTTQLLENGSLQRYTALMAGFAIVAAAWPLLAPQAAGLRAGTRELLPASPLAIAVWLLLLGAGAALVALHRQRFVAVVLAGVIGLVTALTFEAFSAPDLALTQLSVEVVSTVLLLMGLALLPATSPAESPIALRIRDATLSVAAGAGVAWLAWLVLTRDHASIAWYFLEQSLPAGGGSNVVNVILVDFRGYDTFGEITVLGIAAVGALALLDGWRAHRPPTDADGRPWSFAHPPLMLRIAARLVLPLALAVSLYVFWRGHQLPGGGFIAGLITAAALVVQYMALGQHAVESRLGGHAGTRYTRWIAGGLAIAGATGVAAMAIGRPFLTSAHAHPHLPVLGEVGLASAALFDLGVYVTVVGATMLLLSALAKASKEGHVP